MKWMTHFFLGQTRSTPRGFQLKILFVTFPSSYVPNLYTIYWSKLIRLILPQLFLGSCCTLYFLFRFLYTGRILYEIYFHLSLVDTTCMHVYCVYIYSMSFTHVPWQSSHGNGGIVGESSRDDLTHERLGVGAGAGTRWRRTPPGRQSRRRSSSSSVPPLPEWHCYASCVVSVSTTLLIMSRHLV